MCFGWGGFFWFFFSNGDGLLPPCLIYFSISTGVRTGCHYSKPVSVCNIRHFYRLRELYEADFHKPGIYGSGRVGANSWHVFHRKPSRGGRGRRAAVDFVVCFGWGGFFSRFFFAFFFFERIRAAASMRPLASFYLSTNSTDCESCTTRISTNPGSIEAGESGRTRGTRFVARRFQVVAFAGLLWIS